MVRKNTLKTNILKTFSIIAASICAGTTFVVGSSVYATATCTTTNGIKTCTCDGSPCDADSNFQVNVTEILSVALTKTMGGQGDAGDFLRNKVGLSIVSNNAAGVTASMTTKGTNTQLVSTTVTSDPSANLSGVDSSMIIPTLSANTKRSAFNNQWGYSLASYTKTGDNSLSSLVGDDESNGGDGNTNSDYRALVNVNGTPIVVLKTSSPTDDSAGQQTVYFGAKADSNKASGTFANTVVFSVVGGVITDDNDNPNDNPITPLHPATPDDTVAVNPSYNSTYDYTTYTSTTTAGSGSNQTKTTTTTVTQGDTRTSYAAPQGVISSFLGFCEESPLAAGLVIAAVVSALGGLAFFVVAKHKKDKEDDDSSD
ncbi:hypothetical protein IKE79_01320 [Candidatus Saccharibacteria bacterium]|nr:hypothetical protein [Candidatus Saccharibacteria bacterium]